MFYGERILKLYKLGFKLEATDGLLDRFANVQSLWCDIGTVLRQREVRLVVKSDLRSAPYIDQ